MTQEQFETLLDSVAAQLTAESRQNLFTTSKAFEIRVREVLEQLAKNFKRCINIETVEPKDV